MVTLLIALTVLGGCTAARWYFASRRERSGGRVELTALWNEGAAFGLPVPKGLLVPVSAVVLALLWTRRRCSRLGTGLVLGGGISNLLERLRHGRVYDYIRFPRAPGSLRRYVYNLADLAIFAGTVLMVLGTRRKARRSR
jgi:signal peptidase II